MVSRLVATSSGKCRVMNASPGRSVGSKRDRRLDRAAPRDDADALAVGDAVALAVLGRDGSSVSPRRSGEAKPPVCTPVLNESSRRPVVSRIGKSSSRARRPAGRARPA